MCAASPVEAFGGGHGGLRARVRVASNGSAPGLIDELVMSDPADTRTRFQRDPSAENANDVHTHLPEVALKHCGRRYRPQANTEQMTQHGSD